MILAWDDRWIPAGTAWKPEIDRRFGEADVVVLLVSDDFLKSEFCMQQEVPLVMARAERGDAVIVPVIVRPCAWQEAVFAKYQAVLPHGRAVIECGDRADAWRRVLHRIASARPIPSTTAA